MTNSIKRYGSPDGIYGRETKGAVDAYQTGNGLTNDGVVEGLTCVISIKVIDPQFE